MLIDDYELPEFVIECLLTIVDLIPDDDIVQYVKSNKSLLKGYQLNKKNAKTFRRRIKKLIATAKNIDKELLGYLGEYSLGGTFLIYISLPIIALYYENLVDIFTFTDVMIAFLLDPREKLRELAIEKLSEITEPPTEPEKEHVTKSLIELSDSLEPLFDQLSILGELAYIDNNDFDNEDSDIDIAEYSEATAKQQQQIIQLNAELKEAKEYEKKERKLSRTLKEKSEKLQRLESELKKEKSEHKQAVSELKKLNNRLEQKENELSSGINSGTQAELKLHVRDWLVKPTAVKKYVNNAAEDNKDLLHLTKKILDKQAQKDKHSGNLRTLREQLDKFITAHSDVIRARTEALNPLTELAEVEDKLKQKIIDLQRIIGETDDSRLTDIATDISIQINAVSTIKEMNDIADKLIKISELEIISGNELRRLYAAYHNKQERMYDRLLVDSPNADIPTSLAWRFKYSIDKKEPFVWILDGHNVLFSLKDIFGYDPDSGAPGADARKKLIDAMTALVKDAPQCEVNIFFDGPTYSQEHAATNVKITYSGGEGEHRADNAILEIAEYMQQNSPDLTRVLVTDDRDLAKKAKKHKTAGMRIAEFAAIVVD